MSEKRQCPQSNLREVIRPVGSADFELRWNLFDPTGMVEYFESAQADDVPAGGRVIPVGGSGGREGAAGNQVSGAVGSEGHPGGAVARQEGSNEFHVLAPIEIGFSRDRKSTRLNSSHLGIS